MNAYTTIEESKQLIEAGLDINTADGHLQYNGKEVYVSRELYRNPINAIVWLLKHNYIKSNKNE